MNELDNNLLKLSGQFNSKQEKEEMKEIEHNFLKQDEIIELLAEEIKYKIPKIFDEMYAEKVTEFEVPDETVEELKETEPNFIKKSFSTKG